MDFQTTPATPFGYFLIFAVNLDAFSKLAVNRKITEVVNVVASSKSITFDGGLRRNNFHYSLCTISDFRYSAKPSHPDFVPHYLTRCYILTGDFLAGWSQVCSPHFPL